MDVYSKWVETKFEESNLIPGIILYNFYGIDLQKFLQENISTREKDAIQLIIGAISVLSKKDSTAFSRFLLPCRVLGKGVEGKVISLSFGSEKEIFSLKSSEIIENVINEFLVGWRLNELKLPVFPRTYSIFNASLVVDEKNQILNFYTSSSPDHPCALREYVQGEKILKLLPKLSFEEILSIIVILSDCLTRASLGIKFFHNDLHLNNILIKKEKVNHTLLNTETITLSKVPVVIDFGFSSIYGGIERKLEIEVSQAKDVGELIDVYRLVFEILLNSGPLFNNLKFLGTFFYSSNITPSFVNSLTGTFFIPPSTLREGKIEEFNAWLLNRPEVAALYTEREKNILVREPDFLTETGLLSPISSRFTNSYQWTICQLFNLECEKKIKKSDIQRVVKKEERELVPLITDFERFVRINRGNSAEKEVLALLSGKLSKIQERIDPMISLAEHFGIGLNIDPVFIDLTAYRKEYERRFKDQHDFEEVPASFEIA